MRLTNVAGATAIVEHAGKRMLFDPRLNEGVLHSSWFHWPKLAVGIDYQAVTMRDSVPIERMFGLARAKLWSIQEKKKAFPKATFYFDITNQGRLFKLDYRTPKADELPSGSALEQPYVKLSIDSTLFAMALINHIPWNMADAFIDYERVPNAYDPLAYAMLNHLTI